MEYVNLGTSGLQVSRIWLGMMTYGDPNWREWTLDESETEQFVIRSLELGINTFDTADMYSRGVSEEVTGRLLTKHVSRDEVVIASKVYMPMRDDDPNGRGLSRKHIMEAIDASLSRLGTDYLDLYQIHRWDDSVRAEETMEALHDVVKAGKARYIGASSMAAWKFARAQRVAEVNGWTRFVSMQPHYNLLYREEEREMLPQCVDMGVGVVPWSPIGRGRLARPSSESRSTTRGGVDGFADRIYADAETSIIDRVGEVAERLGVSRAQVALAWLLRQPGVTAPIIGASKIEHLEDAVGAVDVALSDEDAAYLEEPYRPQQPLVP